MSAPRDLRPYGEGQCLVPRCPSRLVNWESFCLDHWLHGEDQDLMPLGTCIVAGCEEFRGSEDGLCDWHYELDDWGYEYRKPLRKAPLDDAGVDVGKVFSLMAQGSPKEWAYAHAESQRR